MLSAINAEQLNKTMDPVAQKSNLGTEVRNSQLNGMIIVKSNVSSDATGGQIIVIPEAMELVEIIVQCRAANAGGTLILKSGAHAISDAIICAVDKVITRAGTIDDAYSTFAAGASLTVTAHGAGDKGLITLIGYRV